ncbi:MAG: hypothetical protein ABIP74_03440 [Candidatus Saccharimonas sp.]
MSNTDPSGGFQEIYAKGEGMNNVAGKEVSITEQEQAEEVTPKSTTEVQPTPKAKRVAPTGAIIPDRGWPMFQYMVNRSFGRPDLVPAINAAQRAELYHQSRVVYADELVLRLKYLAGLGIQPIICVANVKSSTKTSTVLGVGTVIAEHTRKMTVAMPSTANTATGTIGEMAGITGDVLTIEEYLHHVDQYGTFRTLEQKLPRTNWGLGVIVESSDSAANDEDDALIAPYMRAIDVTLPNVSALILDLGNDNISKRSIATQAARLSHVLVFPFMFDAPVTHNSLSKTMKGYNTDDGIPEDVWNEFYENFHNKDATGLTVATREKVRRSILVATKADSGVDFAHYALSDSQSAYADDRKPWDGTGICVPNEPSIGRKIDGKLVPFDYEAIGLETNISYLEIAVASYEITGVQQGMNIGTPLVAHLPRSIH